MRWLYDFLERSACIDCGCRELCSLDFDHIGPKLGHLGELARGGYGIARLQREIAECEVRCGNCHRRRTAKMRGYYRHQAA